MADRVLEIDARYRAGVRQIVREAVKHIRAHPDCDCDWWADFLRDERATHSQSIAFSRRWASLTMECAA